MLTQYLTEQDLHCTARLLQSYTFYGSPFESCEYCQYYYECCKSKLLSNYMQTRRKLQAVTGVYLSPMQLDDLKAFESWQFLYPEKVELIYPASERKKKQEEYLEMKEIVKRIQTKKDRYLNEYKV